MTPIPAVVPPLPREHSWNETSPRAAAFGWLAAGWRDFTIYPAASISYGLLVSWSPSSPSSACSRSTSTTSCFPRLPASWWSGR